MKSMFEFSGIKMNQLVKEVSANFRLKIFGRFNKTIYKAPVVNVFLNQDNPTRSGLKEEVLEVIEGPKPSEPKRLEPVKQQSQESHRQQTPDRQIRDFLDSRYVEYKNNKSLLLDEGALLVVYSKRTQILLTSDLLVFLLQSSLKIEFPYWFWVLYFRENIDNAVDLLKQSYDHPDEVIRIRVIEVLSEFSDTEDDIVMLAQGEMNEIVIGSTVFFLLKKEKLSSAQRVIANSITRYIVPILPDCDYKDLKRWNIELGGAEKNFLYSKIDTGWKEEKFAALKIICLSSYPSDSSQIDQYLKKISDPDLSTILLLCLQKIGSTKEYELIVDLMMNTRSSDIFFSAIETLASLKVKAIFQYCLEHLKDSSGLVVRLWDESERSKVEECLQSCLIELLNEETYEKLVIYISKNFEPNERGNIFSWRYFSVIKKNISSPEIRARILRESRLSEFKIWNEIVLEVNLKIATESYLGDTDTILSYINIKNLEATEQVLKVAYSLFKDSDIVGCVGPIIENIRRDIDSRLQKITIDGYSEEVIHSMSGDLDSFIGLNYYHKRIPELGDALDELIKDIKKFSDIEDSYLARVAKSQCSECYQVIFNNIGRPFEAVYQYFSKETALLGKEKELLEQVAQEGDNSLVKIEALAALFRLGLMSREEASNRIKLEIEPARDQLKRENEIKDRSDDWIFAHLTYYSGVNELSKIGVIGDFPIVKEATVSNRIIHLSFGRYSHFFDMRVFKELIRLKNSLSDQKERGSAVDALNSLDYSWSHQLLELES